MNSKIFNAIKTEIDKYNDDAILEILSLLYLYEPININKNNEKKLSPEFKNIFYNSPKLLGYLMTNKNYICRSSQYNNKYYITRRGIDFLINGISNIDSVNIIDSQ